VLFPYPCRKFALETIERHTRQILVIKQQISYRFLDTFAQGDFEIDFLRLQQNAPGVG
jgi:hypothetical protein